MGIQIARRGRVSLAPALRKGGRISTRNLQMSFARSDVLATSIAQALRNGQRVVLLDVDYRAPLFGQEKSIEECVRDELGAAHAHLASEIINLDHHTKELSDKTATEIVFENIDKIRSLEGNITILINHGDTDSVISSFVANNIERIYSAEQRQLLIKAARAGDHSEGNFLAEMKDLTPVVRLNLALDQICEEVGLFLRQVWRTEKRDIKQGMQRLYNLVERALASQQSLYTTETEAIIEKNPVRKSYQVVEDVSKGKDIAGVSIDKSVEGYPIVTVDVTTPGLDNFNPIPAYQASSHPAIMLIVRNGRVVGVGRNNKYSKWLNLMGSDRVESLYTRTAMRLKGGAHAGGANVARDAFETLPSPEEALSIAQQFIRESL